MNPKPQEVFAGGSQELQPKRGNDGLTFKGSEPLWFGFMLLLLFSSFINVLWQYKSSKFKFKFLP